MLIDSSSPDAVLVSEGASVSVSGSVSVSVSVSGVSVVAGESPGLSTLPGSVVFTSVVSSTPSQFSRSYALYSQRFRNFKKAP